MLDRISCTYLPEFGHCIRGYKVVLEEAHYEAHNLKLALP